jgi:hypothetical protein
MNKKKLIPKRSLSLLGCVASLPVLPGEITTLVESFDQPATLSSGKQTSSEPGYMLSQTTTDPFEGAAATTWNFNFLTDATGGSETVWGGSAFIGGHGNGYNLSGNTGLSLRYRSLTGMDDEDVTFIVRLIENSDGVFERWRLERTASLESGVSTWQELRLPFAAFELPSWLPQGNGNLNLGEITNWEIEIVAETGGVEKIISGSIDLDALSLYVEPSYSLVLENFEDLEGIGFSTNTTTDPGITLTTVDETPFEGSASVQADYNFVADAGSDTGNAWGGSVTIAGPGSGFALDGYAGLAFRYRTITPIGLEAPIVLNLKLVDDSDGVAEYWQTEIDGVLTDTSGEWTEILVPFTSLQLPEWVPQGNGELDLAAVNNWQIELFVNSEGVGETFTGSLQFDSLQAYAAPSFLRSIEDFGQTDRLASWVNTSSVPGIVLSSESTMAFEGNSSLRVDVDFAADLDWGGSVTVAGRGEGYDFSDATAIGLRMWVDEAFEAEAPLEFIVRLVDTSEGVSEYWEWKSKNLLATESTMWNSILIPFAEFELPGYLPVQGNQQLDLDAIANWQVELRASSASGETYQGSILLDGMALFESNAMPRGPGIFADYELVDGQYVSLGTQGGWVLVDRYPWVYFFDVGAYIYVAESSGTSAPGWMYLPYTGEAVATGGAEGYGPAPLDMYEMASATALFAEGWLGWLDVGKFPWTFSYGLNTYVFVSSGSDEPGWFYLP